MDQFISTMGKAGHLLLIDCRSQNYELVPFGSGPNSPVIIVTNSLVKHKLSGSEYPDRVKSCKEAVRVIQSIHPKVIALRDVTMQMLDEVHRSLAGVRGMSEQTYKRAKHSITEDFRTLDTIEALKSGDFKRVGINMTASHISLRDDFEVL
jgi:galactokinase